MRAIPQADAETSQNSAELRCDLAMKSQARADSKEHRSKGGMNLT
jgi:hypothetical protein